MKLAEKPRQLPNVFSSSGAKNTIPDASSQESLEKGLATYDSGFPPVTIMAIAAGGIPPHGKDFNGVLNDITAAIRYSQAGGLYPFNTEFATAIGGYSKGAIVLSSDGSKIWQSIIDSNLTNPDGTSASGWRNLLADPSGLFLKVANNLFDLNNKVDSRYNLEVFSKTESQTDAQGRANIAQSNAISWADSNCARKPTASLQTAGWFRDATTGLITQWGTISGTTGQLSGLYPITFPNAVFQAVVTLADKTAGSSGGISLFSNNADFGNRASLTVWPNGTDGIGTTTARFIVIGY